MARRKKWTGLALPAPIRTLGRELLDVQMWCFGRDVRYADGNLLVEYGFDKLASPDERFHSLYRHPDGWQLWSWGLWISQTAGSLYLPRQRFEVSYMPCAFTPLIWQPADLSELIVPTQPEAVQSALALFQGLCTAIIAYENWVQERGNSRHRQQVIEAHPNYRHYRHISAASLVSQWQSISTGVHHAQ